MFTHSPMTPNYVFDDNNLSRQMQKHNFNNAQLGYFTTSFGKQTAADHKIFNREKESRNDHRNPLMVRDGFSYWTQTYARATLTRGGNSTLSAEFFASISNTWARLHSLFKGLYQSVSRAAMGARSEYSSSLRNRWHRGKSCSMSWKEGAATAMFQSGLPVESWDSTVTCCCYLQKSARHSSRWQDSYGDTIGATFDGEVVLFWSKRQIRTHLFQKRVSVTSVRIEDVNWTTHGICLTCGEEDGHVICSWQIAKMWKTCQPPKSTSKDSNTKKIHRKNLCHFHARTVLLSISIFVIPAVVNAQPAEEETEEGTVFEEESGNIFGA